MESIDSIPNPRNYKTGKSVATIGKQRMHVQDFMLVKPAHGDMKK